VLLLGFGKGGGGREDGKVNLGQVLGRNTCVVTLEMKKSHLDYNGVAMINRLLKIIRLFCKI